MQSLFGEQGRIWGNILGRQQVNAAKLQVLWCVSKSHYNQALRSVRSCYFTRIIITVFWLSCYNLTLWKMWQCPFILHKIWILMSINMEKREVQGLLDPQTLDCTQGQVRTAIITSTVWADFRRSCCSAYLMVAAWPMVLLMKVTIIRTRKRSMKATNLASQPWPHTPPCASHGPGRPAIAGIHEHSVYTWQGGGRCCN